MATAVVGGLTTSTLLTLFVVPTVYTIFDDLARFFRKDKRDLAAPELVERSVEAIEREAGYPAEPSGAARRGEGREERPIPTAPRRVVPEVQPPAEPADSCDERGYSAYSCRRPGGA